jgi:signal transduction histidine kinase
MNQAYSKKSAFTQIVIAATVGVAGFAILMGLSLFQERNNREVHARLETQNIARVLEEHALMTVEKIDLVLIDMQQHMPFSDMLPRREALRGSRVLHELLNSKIATIPEADVIHIANSEGDYIYSSLETVPVINIADRPFFQTHRNNRASGLVISQPLLSRTLGTWAITLSRRLSTPDGRFAGIVNVIITLRNFEKFYATLDMGSHGAVLLRDADMRLLARYPRLEANMGKPMPNHPLLKFLGNGIEQGTYNEISPADGTKRIYSFRRVGTYPLYVLAAIADRDYLSEWRKHVIWYSIVGVVIFFASLVLALLARAGLLRQVAAEAELADHHEHLELLVNERTAELNERNIEVQQAYDDLKKVQAQLLQQDKMASVGQLAAGVAHEINNPMGFIISNLGSLGKYVEKLTSYLAADENVLNECDPAIREMAIQERQKYKIDHICRDMPELIAESSDGAQRVRQIVQDLKSFSRVDGGEFANADINDGLDSTLSIAANELKYKAAVTREYSELPKVWCNMGQLNQVFLNILVNAAHAIEERGEIRIVTREEAGSVLIAISDSGGGILPENLKKIFDPFFTTKEVGKGTGLGLAIAYDIITNKHGGLIEVESKIGVGTTFTITLPVTTAQEGGT